MLAINITGMEKLVKMANLFSKEKKKVDDAIKSEAKEFIRRVVDTARKKYLSGPGPQRLQERSGKLKRSLRGNIKDTGKEMSAFVYSATKYARIHEFGGITSPHVILPKKSAVLSFMANGKRVFTKKVNHPGSIIPARPFLGPSIEDEAPMFEAKIAAILSKVGRI